MRVCIVIASVHVSKLSHLINNLKTMVNEGAISVIAHEIFVHRILKPGANSPLAACLMLPSLLKATNFIYTYFVKLAPNSM